MNSRRKGLISFVVMVVLTMALILGSESIYNALKQEPAEIPEGAVALQTAAPGFGGDVVVSTALSADGTRIEEVTIVDCSTETPDIGQKAAPEVAAVIVEQQSLTVDGVSGATMTSDAVKTAVEMAIGDAGFDAGAFGVSAAVEEEAMTAEPAGETTEEAREETDAAEEGTEAAASEPAVAAGEYEASAPGYGGDVKISVIMAEDGSIQGVRILDCSTETPDIGQKAASEIAKAIVVNQTTEVEAVSGATMTSNAVMEAAAQAIGGSGTPASVPAAAEDTETAAEETNAVTGETNAPEAEGGAELTEYEASAKGFAGEVKVSVALNGDGSIAAVKILDCETETADLGQAAAPKIAKAIVEAQSADVDVVSGATLTSNAVIEAVKKAMELQ